MNSTVYVCPFFITISRWRTWASQGFVPFLSTFRQNAPLTTAPLPVAGSLNDVVHGRLTPSSKSLFLRRLFPPEPGAIVTFAAVGVGAAEPVSAFGPSAGPVTAAPQPGAT